MENSKSPIQEVNHTSKSKLEEVKTSLFGQKGDSDEEEEEVQRRGTESSLDDKADDRLQKKRKASTALWETSTSESERELKSNKVRLEIRLNGITLWLTCVRRKPVVCLEPVQVLIDKTVVEIRLRVVNPILSTIRRNKFRG